MSGHINALALRDQLGTNPMSSARYRSRGQLHRMEGLALRKRQNEAARCRLAAPNEVGIIAADLREDEGLGAVRVSVSSFDAPPSLVAVWTLVPAREQHLARG